MRALRMMALPARSAAAFALMEDGDMDDVLMRFFGNLLDRIGGAMSFRLVLQPAMATLFAVRAGWQDGLAGRRAYFWSILSVPEDRRELLREGWKAVAKVFVMAIVVDTIYQAIELRWFYPGEAIVVAFVLAFVPYLLIRGPVGRAVRWWQGRHSS
jgi:hypothetical protein